MPNINNTSDHRYNVLAERLEAVARELRDLAEIEQARKNGRFDGQQFPTNFKGSEPPNREAATCTPSWAE